MLVYRHLLMRLAWQSSCVIANLFVPVCNLVIFAHVCKQQISECLSEQFSIHCCLLAIKYLLILNPIGLSLLLASYDGSNLMYDNYKGSENKDD